MIVRTLTFAEWNQLKRILTFPYIPLSIHSNNSFINMSSGKVIIYGGNGALGSVCVAHFKQSKFWVGSVDYKQNNDADLSIILEKNDHLRDQEQKVTSTISNLLENTQKLDAIICVAGGWKVGNAKTSLATNTELMWQKSVHPSLICASLATRYLKDDGLLCLTGANAALGHTPKMIGYGLAKNAVHQLIKNLSAKGSGMPGNSVSVAILPDILDTPFNRKWIPKGDYTSWTPLSFLAQLLVNWCLGIDRPSNGDFIQIVTKHSSTKTEKIKC